MIDASAAIHSSESSVAPPSDTVILGAVPALDPPALPMLPLHPLLALDAPLRDGAVVGLLSDFGQSGSNLNVCATVRLAITTSPIIKMLRRQGTMIAREKRMGRSIMDMAEPLV